MVSSGAGRSAEVDRVGVAGLVGDRMLSIAAWNSAIAGKNAMRRMLVATSKYRHNYRVITHPEPTRRLRLQGASVASRLVQVAQHVVATTGEGRIVAWALGGFVVVWMLYDTVSLLTVDLHWDSSEAALWAQHFAFGYKHPPMTAWLFSLWFAIFPRADWAAHLLAVTVVAITLAVTWRLARDHLDKERALFGLAALFLIPLYTFKASELAAGTAMMPFWPAALLFYLRARRGLGVWDALLAGAFASLTMLAKYWAIYLFAGMAVASVLGVDARRFWRSPAPYLMAVGAAIVIAPHLYWYVSQAGGSSYAFVHDHVMNHDSFMTALGRSLRYLLGTVAYAIGPLVLFAALRPNWAALADTVWPADAERRQALILFAVPMVLPALANLVLPHRLTAAWTYPNWALLPVVLYGSRKLVVDAAAAATAGLVALVFGFLVLVASPVVAYQKLRAGSDPNRPDAHQVAEAAELLAGGAPVRLFWGSAAVTGGLPFYLPNARPLDADPLSADGRTAIETAGLLVVCLDNDAPCISTDKALTDSGGEHRSADLTIRHSLLGFSGPPTKAHFTIVPALP
jgi:4-amino-4-deoxy-L-arabinose transferase-like glycosyltransferase